ncbi:hypothetical protein [Pseudomonas baetica]|uniref:hypothetical protein n=1 Tax=Pseudomonas baetica TaxID=674054 RepID=UPI00240653BB|nr:hypothetical protein [Pseudomonas baetica]MDF9779167.1 small nuclear ribonucleoprotein (snRNP)-like protein [Pseudomonas baetica]
MNTFETPRETAEGRDIDHHSTAKPVETEHRYKAMPALSPIRPAEEVVTAEAAHPDLIEDEAVVEMEAPLVPDLPDNEDVELNLKLADQLQVIGDFEGVTEYANLILDDSKASIRQKERAQTLLRRDKSL